MPNCKQIVSTRWAVFVTWCRENKISPSRPSIDKIFRFLNFLWKEKLGVGTIKGYRSTLNSVLRHTGRSISSDQEMAGVIRSLIAKKPVKCKEIVNWNVDVVLKYLCSEKLEPLQSASLRDLIKKTLVLVSLALTKRVSEIQALSKSVGFSSQGA